MSSSMQEIAGLEALESQMARNLEGLKQQRDDAKFSRTFGGRIFNFGGCLFAIYCVYRIFVVSISSYHYEWSLGTHSILRPS